MASKIQQIQLPDATTFLADLLEIAETVHQAKEVDKEQTTFARRLKVLAQDLAGEQAIKYLSAIDVSDETREAVAATIHAWASDIVPDATVQWERETVAAKLGFLQSLVPLGALSTEQVEQLAFIRDAMTVKRAKSKSSGAGTRQPMPSIEGHPANVEVYHGGKRIARQRGDTAQSSTNIRMAVVRYLATQTVLVTKKDANDVALREALSSVCNGKEEVATVVIDGVSLIIDATA